MWSCIIPCVSARTVNNSLRAEQCGNHKKRGMCWILISNCSSLVDICFSGDQEKVTGNIRGVLEDTSDPRCLQLLFWDPENKTPKYGSLIRWAGEIVSELMSLQSSLASLFLNHFVLFCFVLFYFVSFHFRHRVLSCLPGCLSIPVPPACLLSAEIISECFHVLQNFFLEGMGCWTQGLALGRQAVYTWATPPAPQLSLILFLLKVQWRILNFFLKTVICLRWT
jgi:hypothetical protein